MQLLQMLLPIKDEKDHPFPGHYFADLREELATKFGGITIYSRSPVKGLWKEASRSRMSIIRPLSFHIDPSNIGQYR